MKEIAIYDNKPANTMVARTIFDLIVIDPNEENFFRYKHPTIIVSKGKKYYEYPTDVINSDEFMITDLLTKSLILVWK